MPQVYQDLSERQYPALRWSRRSKEGDGRLALRRAQSVGKMRAHTRTRINYTACAALVDVLRLQLMDTIIIIIIFIIITVGCRARDASRSLPDARPSDRRGRND